MTLDEEMWRHNQVFGNSFTISDSTKRYDIFLDIEHSTTFEYQNIYTTIGTMFPDKKVTEQVIPINFADKLGKWYGKCQSKTCQLRVVLQHDIRFRPIGEYEINIGQHSRIDSLQGINSLSFVLQELDGLD